jgi:hypothetical protein
MNALLLDDDHDDGYKNWTRLVQTQVYLRTYFAGRTLPPPREFYGIHYNIIHQYLKVVLGTPDADQEVVPYLEQLIEDYNQKFYFDLNVYLIACTKLMGAKEDYDFLKEMQDLTM